MTVALPDTQQVGRRKTVKTPQNILTDFPAALADGFDLLKAICGPVALPETNIMNKLL
jgi:hypothetical protein